MSLEMIVPFFRPIRHLLEAETVSEIMVNPDSSIWIEEDGKIQSLSGLRFDDGALLAGLEVVANRFGKKLDADSPILNLRLPDGSRMAALIPPVVHPRPMITIRKFTSRGFTMTDLINRGMLTEAQAQTLSYAVACGKNLLISGGTNSGKTTLLNVLAGLSPSTNAFSSLKIRLRYASGSPTSYPPRPSLTLTKSRSGSPICSRPLCGIVQTGSSSAKYGAVKRAPFSTP